MSPADRCPECGLPYPECNAFTIARQEAIRYLREDGYDGLDATRIVNEELMPDRRKEVAAARAAGRVE